MRRNQLVLIFLVLSLVIPVGLAHTETGELGTEGVIEFDVNILFLATAIIAILVFIGVKFQKQLKVKHEKVIFVAIAIASLAATGYLIGLTSYWVVTSESEGPVHWHADYEIWVCGQEVELPDPVGLENRVGNPIFHHHGDNRIHVEGILIELEEADLGHFFEVVGGELTPMSIAIPQDLPPASNPRTYKNGDACPNGRPGTLYVFVNSVLIENPPEYILSPFSTIPPGDEIKFVFDDKTADQLNTELGVAP